jgi:hypothetical protein
MVIPDGIEGVGEAVGPAIDIVVVLLGWGYDGHGVYDGQAYEYEVHCW